ncbi:MAG: tetratricopeptide repeat protein [Leptolyngbya sp. SIO1E4]|nr:tetratricopeptide repeat protein [Leptolyngbya sp. SIO1E4]
MTAMTLPDAIQHYAGAIASLEKTANAETVLAVLQARDQVEAARQSPAGTTMPELFLHLITLDDRLLEQARNIHNTVDLEAWQKSLQPPESAWWWFLEKPIHVRDRYDWLWSALTVTSLTASASLVVDIGGRFLTAGAPGLWGSFALIGQSVLTLATAGGVLTDGGRRFIENALDSTGLGRHWWQETKLGLSLMLLAGLVGFHNTLPVIAERIVENGQTLEEQGNLQEAETAYKRAISLDQENSEANYRLGELYADLGRTESAQDQLLLATRGDFLPAYNRLAALYLENENPDAVIELLTPALDQIEDTPETQALRAELWSNLGWARLQQGRYAEAEQNLRKSIAIETPTVRPESPESNDAPSIDPSAESSILESPESDAQRSTASSAESRLAASNPDAQPHCLLFQTAEASGDRATAELAARSCVAFANPLNSQQDQWAYEARAYLQGSGTWEQEGRPAE